LFHTHGRPLRASVTINWTQQKITEFTFRATAGPGAKQSPGTRPLTPAPQGKSVQSMADSQGQGDSWQAIASANGIENPRLWQPGQWVDLNASVSFQAEGSITI